MPIYRYRCVSCEHVMVLTKSIADRNNTPVCSKCSGITRRHMNLEAAPQFKGPGFYATDYKKK